MLYNTALVEQAEMLRVVAENAPIGLWRVNNNGDFIYCNKKFEEIVDHAFKELKNRNFFNIIFDKDKEIFTEHYLAGCDGKKGEFELRIVKHNGNIRWVRSIYSPIINKSFKGFVGILMDITRNKQQSLLIPQLRQMQLELRA